MGLLDDAIREHLELKRQRGADPSEVAREQREALDAPVQGPSEDAALAGETASAAPLVDPPPAAAPVAAVSPDAASDGAQAALPDAPADVAVAGETAELDMSSVLGEEPDDAPGPAAALDTSPSQEDSLEWEMPGETTADGDAEDVLEETPEFLRDTPEQERLWFEQRPPRDFDFDK
ncbi:MAG TPA: hypothetical protein VN817_07985 [Solirubrobacteraceae bacterium]|nr:hypothetical protein [Solirubrobacteraceae bacterium]